MKKGLLLFLPLLFMACQNAMTVDQVFWVSRGQYNNAKHGFDDVLVLDNAQLQSCYQANSLLTSEEVIQKCKPILDKDTRDRAYQIILEADSELKSMDELISSGATTDQVFAEALGKIQSLTTRLLLAYQYRR